jgi:serine/threonine protein kinase
MNSNISIYIEKDENKHYEMPIGENFILKTNRKIGSGAFGEIYLGTDIKQGKNVAIKIEPYYAKSPQLLYESEIYMELQGGSK